MPEFDSAINTIVDRFITQFHAERSSVPVALDNFHSMYESDGSFTPSEQAKQDSNGDPRPWVRVSVRPGNAFLVTLGKSGNRVWRHPGVIIVGIFTVAGTGYLLPQQIGKDAATAFRGITDSGVRFGAPSQPQHVGLSGAWYQMNVRCDYEFDLTA